MRFRSKPSQIEAVRWTGDNWQEVRDFAGERVEWHGPRNAFCYVFAGPAGISDWVFVPDGAWIARDVETGDDYWPLDNTRMLEKYEEVY